MTGQSPAQPSDLFGGKRGLIDSAVPPVVFVAVNAVSGLRPAVWAALGAGALLVVVRALRREELRHIVSGFFGVALAAVIAARTGKAENFFLPGIVLNAAYAVACVVSVLAGRPLLGLLLRQFDGRSAAWHEHPRVRRAYAEVTLGWAAVFALRVAVQGALVLAGRPGWLAVTKIAMGWPLFLVALAATLPWVARRTAGVVDPDPADESAAAVSSS